MGRSSRKKTGGQKKKKLKNLKKVTDTASIPSITKQKEEAALDRGG